MDYGNIITIEPGKRAGKPCICGLRITVYDVLEYLASGMSEAQILQDFPDLTATDIRACWAFAADRERRLLSIPAWSYIFDQNLSHRLVAMFAGSFPGSSHVRDFNLDRADDAIIWEFAKNNGFTIVSKDDDFHQRSFLFGHPPKVVWLRLGNCTTDQIAATLQQHAENLVAFEGDPNSSFLVLS